MQRPEEISTISRFPNFLEEGDRLPRYLVHVVVLIRTQPAREMHVRSFIGKQLVAPIEICILRLRNRIIRVAFRTGIFVNHTCFVMLLSGKVLELCNTRVGVLIWIVHNCGRLKFRGIDRLVIET